LSQNALCRWNFLGEAVNEGNGLAQGDGAGFEGGF
jgi:hypothetical protein